MESYYLCPIYFFEYDNEQVELPENIKIIKTPPKLIEYLQRNYPHSLPTILSETEWTIAIKNEYVDTTDLQPIEMISIGLRQEERARYQLIDLISALRLYKKGRIVAGLLTSSSFENSKWSVGGTTIWTSVSNLIFFQEKPIYTLKQSELDKFITLFQNIRGYRISNIIEKIEIALSRFHSSYHGDIEDRLIDQIIAFESLLLGNEQELTYKLALRTAFLLRTRKDFRNKIFTNMKKAYNYRSKIVHGDNPPNRKILGGIVPNTENYLRQSIKKILNLLSQGKSLNDIRNNLLDNNIIQNGKTLL